MKDIKLGKKIYFNSPVILIFALVCVILCVLNYMTVGAVNRLFALRHIGFQLITYIFVHSGFDHLFSNMVLLMLVGPSVEEKYGSEFTAIAIMSTAIVSGILNCLLFSTGVLGASGIVFLLIVLSAFKSFKDNRLPLTTIIVIALYLGREVLNGILVNDEISQFGHIIGGVCGIVWGIYLNKRINKVK